MDKTIDILKKVNIFKGVSDDSLQTMLDSDGVSVSVCKKGECIRQDSHRLMIILSGSVVVTNGSAILRTMTKGAVFGIVTLFSDQGAETVITAKTDCKLLTIPENAVKNLLISDSTASLNYIRFLTDRIHFLNSVIDRYTRGNSRDNLSAYLLSISRQRGDSFSLNMSATASRLNIGRASLYRAIDTLCEKGAITKNGREITILDKNCCDGTER